MATATDKPKKKSRFSDIFAKYKTYDPQVEGYGDPSQWSQQFHDRMGFEEAEEIIRANVNGKTPHEILGVTTTATIDEIKKAYRKLALTVHPDYAAANGMTKEQAEAAFKKLQAAYTLALRQAEMAPKPKPTPAPAPSRPAPAPKWSPQLLNAIEEAEARRYAASKEWIAQEKFDGHRHTLTRVKDVITATNKLGNETGTNTKVLSAFINKQGSFRVDGELVGDIFYAFDLLEADGQDLRHLPYRVRYAFMEKWLPQTSNCVLVVSHCGNADIIDVLRRKGAEGVVFKRADAPYTAGRPSEGGDHLKFKFWNTASFIVGEQNGEKASVTLLLLDGDKEVFVGSCTISANHRIPTPGSIIEVRYLHAFRGGSVYQSTYLGERDDVLREECTVSQLRYKGEER
jgi:bifunctional non-homologous end joining protein LigD